jgi:single-strand DNA-binding protein
VASFNRVILAGNLTRDPELSYLPSGTPVCKFGLAVNRRYRDKDGNPKEEVCYVDLTAFGRQGETINQYMTKGQAILIEGRLSYRQWTDKEGKNRSKLDVVVEGFTFLGSGQRTGGAPGGPGGPGGPREGGWQQRPPARPAPQQQYAPPPPAAEEEPPPLEDEGPPPREEDIPF